MTFGVTPAEAGMRLPGDEVLPRSDLTATRGITIEAGPAKVWPWLVQLGQGRGGFYSYDALENLVGCDIHSADEIVPAWQHLEVGEEVRLHPEVALTVAEVEPDHALVLRGAVSATGDQQTAPYDFTWAFVLRAEGADTTRLLVRERYAYLQPAAAALVEPVAVVSFVMTQRMLRGIRDRAERAGR
ncbi:MAG: SRPBCC family protein [Nitriliruptor sp.]|nr:MAG: SRPBCC family protein [Nitriliruptor sp.]